MTKFAEALNLITTITSYEIPLVQLFVDPSTNQHWLIAWADEQDELVVWHAIQVSEENLPRLCEEDFTKAITLKDLILQAGAVYQCRANTYNYGSVIVGTKLDTVSDELMPQDGSFMNVQAWRAWDAHQKRMESLH